jgi:hypothetical protein
MAPWGYPDTPLLSKWTTQERQQSKLGFAAELNSFPSPVRYIMVDQLQAAVHQIVAGTRNLKTRTRTFTNCAPAELAIKADGAAQAISEFETERTSGT